MGALFPLQSSAREPSIMMPLTLRMMGRWQRMSFVCHVFAKVFV
jgi:hypothetical protein